MVRVDPSVDLVIPAHNEESTIAGILHHVLTDPETTKLLSQIIVVNDFSTDRTAEVALDFGATVVHTEEVGLNGPGKGEALWLGFQHCNADIIVTCDADLENFQPRSLRLLVEPLLDSESTLFAKAAYQSDPSHESQRVTTLTARPLLAIYYPELATLASPLAGEIAVRANVLEQARLVSGFGVDVALLVDAYLQGGRSSIVEVDLGVKRHRHHSLAELGHQAEEVTRAILDCANVLPRNQISGSSTSTPTRLPPINRQDSNS